jgi:CO/xanthine dehydrogenase Mo-binding subunit
MVTQSRLKTTILDVRIDRVCSVDDAGVAINPLTLDGQLHGSLAQAVGEMLMESVIYERGTGQLLTGSFMDYAMPRAKRATPRRVWEALNGRHQLPKRGAR